jgi:hypothetical protein
MALRDTRSEEQKEADRQRETWEAQQRERQLAERQAADAVEAEAYGQFVAALPKWEYKVLTHSALAGWDDGTIQNLEPLLNEWASHGWRVVTMSFTGQINQALAMNKNHLYMVLERPARHGGHAGAPVSLPAARPASPPPPPPA